MVCEWASKILPGQVCHLKYLPGERLGEQKQYDPCGRVLCWYAKALGACARIKSSFLLCTYSIQSNTANRNRTDNVKENFSFEEFDEESLRS